MYSFFYSLLPRLFIIDCFQIYCRIFPCNMVVFITVTAIFQCWILLIPFYDILDAIASRFLLLFIYFIPCLIICKKIVTLLIFINPYGGNFLFILFFIDINVHSLGTFKSWQYRLKKFVKFIINLFVILNAIVKNIPKSVKNTIEAHKNNILNGI